MYSLLNLIATGLLLNGGGEVSMLHQASHVVAVQVMQGMINAQESRLLALRSETNDLDLYPPVAVVAALPIPEIAIESTVTQVAANSITVLPAPVATRAPVVAATTPKPVAATTPRPTATARPTVVSAPVAPAQVVPTQIAQAVPSTSVSTVPPLVAPPATAVPAATVRPSVPVQNVAIAQPATTNQASAGAPQINGPVLTAINSEHVSTYYLTIPKLGLTNIPVNPTDARNDTKWKNDLKAGVGQLLCPPASNCKTVIFGHSSNYASVISNYNYVFKDLVKLTTGDEVQIQYQGQNLRYRVVKSEVVGADTASIVTNYGREELVLFTCWPFMTSKNRAVVYLDRIY